MRTLLIKIDIADMDSETLRLSVPNTCPQELIKQALTKANQECFDKDLYGIYGCTPRTLMAQVCKNHPTWHYKTLEPDIHWCDLDVG